MSPRQKWVLASLALWALPAVFFWIAFWRWDESRQQAAQGRAIAELTAFLDRARLAGDPLWPGSVGWSRALARWVRTGRLRRPAAGWPGQGHVILFDARGRVQFPRLPPAQQDAIERFFAWIRRPAWTYEPLPPDGFAEAAPLLPEPARDAVTLRTRGGGRLWWSPVTTPSPVSLPVAGFWWKPRPAAERAGLLVVLPVFPERPTEAWQRVVKGAAQAGRQLGFVLPGGYSQAPAGVPRDTWLAALERYRREPGHVVHLAAGSLVFREAPQGVLLAGFLPPLPRRDGLTMGLAAGFLALSLLVLARLHAFYVRGVPFRLSLGGKLLVLLGLGVGFPLVLAATVGATFLYEKEAALVEEAHRTARSFLEKVDTGFEAFAAHRGLVYARRLGEHRRPPPSLDQVVALANRCWSAS